MFGGPQLTATDLAVAAGRIRLGNPGRVQALPKTTLNKGLDYIQHTLEEYIDRVKLSADPVPVVAVGGGNILFPDALRGVSEMPLAWRLHRSAGRWTACFRWKI